MSSFTTSCGEPPSTTLSKAAVSGAHQSYGLPLHVFMCCVPGGVVFLDLKRDRYCAVAAEDAQAVAPLVRDWPTAPRPDCLPTDTEVAAQELLQSGLIVPWGPSAKSAAPVCTPTIDTLIAHRVHRPRVRLRDLARFIVACVSAGLALRFLPFERVVKRAVTRKKRAGNSAPSADAQSIADTVAIFRLLRVYLFTAKDRCLFHSLALVNFLAYYRIFPTWILGVKTAPFTAHSWVQAGQVVLDFSAEDALFYTPIIAI